MSSYNCKQILKNLLRNILKFKMLNALVYTKHTYQSLVLETSTLIPLIDRLGKYREYHTSYPELT